MSKRATVTPVKRAVKTRQGHIGPQSSRGLALVLALLIVSLIAAISVELTWRFDLSLNRSGNRWYGLQAQAYLQGAENLAKMVLRQDLEDTEIDDLGEDWAQEPTPFPTDEGWVKGKLEDAQGRFNLNSLIPVPSNTDDDNAENGTQAPSLPVNNSSSFTAGGQKSLSTSQERFVRLLQTVALGEEEEGQQIFVELDQAREITEALIDWMDQDDEVTGFGGAESDYYEQLEPPITISNRPLISVSELSVVKGMTPEIYRALLPLIIALPGNVAMNVNTMQLALLRSINVRNALLPISEEDAQLIFDDRETAAFSQVQDFADNPNVQSALSLNPNNTNQDGNPNLDLSGLGTTSEYFIFFGETMVGDKIKMGRSLIKRSADDIVVVRRTDANF